MRSRNGQHVQRAALGKRVADFLVHPCAATEKQGRRDRRVARGQFAIEKRLLLFAEAGGPMPKRKLRTGSQATDGVGMIGRHQAGDSLASQKLGGVETPRIPQGLGTQEPSANFNLVSDAHVNQVAAYAKGGPSGDRHSSPALTRRRQERIAALVS